MSPAQKFYEWLEVVLNSIDVGQVFLIHREESNVVFASTGEVLNIPRLVVACDEIPEDMEVIVGGISQVFDEFDSQLWANERHGEYLIGWARPLNITRQGKSLVFSTGEPKDIPWMRAVPCGYHNETQEWNVRRKHAELDGCY
jgi:hypothetical protein